MIFVFFSNTSELQTYIPIPHPASATRQSTPTVKQYQPVCPNQCVPVALGQSVGLGQSVPVSHPQSFIPINQFAPVDRSVSQSVSSSQLVSGSGLEPVSYCQSVSASQCQSASLSRPDFIGSNDLPQSSFPAAALTLPEHLCRV